LRKALILLLEVVASYEQKRGPGAARSSQRLVVRGWGSACAGVLAEGSAQGARIAIRVSDRLPGVGRAGGRLQPECLGRREGVTEAQHK
jgi:hypothetical protein